MTSGRPLLNTTKRLWSRHHYRHLCHPGNPEVPEVVHVRDHRAGADCRRWLGPPSTL